MIVLAEVLAVAAARDGVRVCAHGARRVLCGLRRRPSCSDSVLCRVCAVLDRLALTGKCLLVACARCVTSGVTKILQQWYMGGLCELLANRGLPARVYKRVAQKLREK